MNMKFSPLEISLPHYETPVLTEREGFILSNEDRAMYKEMKERGDNKDDLSIFKTRACNAWVSNQKIVNTGILERNERIKSEYSHLLRRVQADKDKNADIFTAVLKDTTRVAISKLRSYSSSSTEQSHLYALLNIL